MRFTLAALLIIVSGYSATCCYAQQNVVVVLDDSGSMDDRMRTENGRIRRIDAAKQALTSVLGNLPAETKVGVLALNSSVGGSNWIVPFGTGNSQQWIANIRQLEAAGGTPLGEFLKVGADQLLAARGEQVYGTYRLLVVTDGEANDAGLVERYLPDILSRGVMVDVIGVDMESDHSLATRVHQYRRAQDQQSLNQAISEVFAESNESLDDGGETGFDMLEGLPDGMAEGALAALNDRNDEPIEGTTPYNEQYGTSGGFSSSGTSARSSIAGILGGLFCCAGTIVTFVLLAAVLIRVGSSGKR